MKKLKKQFLAAVLTAVMAVIIPLSLGSMRFCRHYSCSGSNPFCQAVHQQNGESHRKIEIL